jgi:SulP family sulfate permease
VKLPRQQAISFTPFAQEYREYNWKYLRNDAWAALAVALMTIPQSIAYSLLAGLPPTAGIFSAIFGTIFAASLGSSRYLVSGPSTGTAILIQTSIAEIISGYPITLAGAEKEALALHILTQIVLIAGLLQVGAAFLNVSKLLQFVSRPVALGYFAGITIAIITTQLFYFTGIKPDATSPSTIGKLWIFITHIFLLNIFTLLVGLISLFTLIFLRRALKNFPDALIMLVISALLAQGIGLWQGEPVISLLSDYNLSARPIPQMTLPFLDLSLLNQIFPTAAAISLLAILEVFSISRNFAAKDGKLPHVNQDVLGLGASNTFLSFIYGALPASGSTTRTALSYGMQAKTRMAAIFSGLFTAAIVYLCWPMVQKIPLSALAALLFATVPSVVNWKEIKLCFRATKEDAWVFLITLSSCLIFSLHIAFFIGILISIATFLLKSATPHLVEYAFNSKGRLIITSPKEDQNRKIRIIGIAGELYFASADVIQEALSTIADNRKTSAIVLRLNNVYHMDASMCLAILQLYETLHSTDRYLIISGLTEEVWHVFHRAGLVKKIGLDNLYFTDEGNPQFSTWKACLRAQDLIHSKN